MKKCGNRFLFEKWKARAREAVMGCKVLFLKEDCVCSLWMMMY